MRDYAMYTPVSKKRVVPYNLTNDDIHIADIAFSLARLNRYLGNTKFPYSVGQHSIILYGLVPDHLKKAAIIHDAAEMFIGDWPHPIKTEVPEIIEFDQTLSKKIFDRYGVPFEHMEELHDYDRGMYREEHEQLRLNVYKRSHRFKIKELDPHTVEAIFLGSFADAFGY